MSTDDLVSWLLEQITVDEQVARAAAEVVPNGEGWYRVAQEAVADPEFSRRYGHAYDHIARHDPARVLAECEAKRAIVAEHSPPPPPKDGEPGWVGCFTCIEFAHEPEPCRTLRLLALPYADRDGWREEWRPAP